MFGNLHYETPQLVGFEYFVRSALETLHSIMPTCYYSHSDRRTFLEAAFSPKECNVYLVATPEYDNKYC